MIEFKINNQIYTEEQFKRDLQKYFKSLKENEEDGIPCNIGLCWKCILNRSGLCSKFECNSEPINNSFEIVKAIRDWATFTNKDKLKEVFGDKAMNIIDRQVTYYYCNDEFEDWLNQEYKEPDKEDRK